MKKIIACLLCLWAVSAVAIQLPLSEQGQQEAALYMHFLQALLAEGENASEEACSQYAQALSYAAENKYLRRQLLVCSLENNQPEAAAIYADFIDRGENDETDLAVYAFYKWRTGDIPEARKYYAKALEKSPEDSRILYQYALLLSYIDTDAAIELLQQQKTVQPELAAALEYETGNLYLRQKNIEKALQHYHTATQESPQYPEPYLKRAEIYEKAGQYFLMLHELESLENIGYQNAVMFTRMASFYVLVKDEARAKQYFEKAKQLDPGNIPANYFLALYAEREENFKQAADYLRAASDYATDAGKWLQVSFYEQQAGQPEQSLATLAEAYKRFEKNVEIGYFYGLLLQDEKQYRRSAKVLEGVLETNPTYEQARLAYAFALEALGKYNKMEKQVLKLVAQNPRHAIACNLLGYSLADRNIRLNEAQQWITRALEIAPQDASFIDSLAWLYYRQKKYQEALQVLAGLPESFFEQNAEAAYHLGAIYAALGQAEKAKLYLQQALSQYPAAAKLLKSLPAQ